MPKKIENPLSEGLISKIYLVAFSEYKTAYQIAKKELDVRTGQVTREINREKYSHLFDREVEREKKKPIRSKVEPFLSRLESNLKEDNTKLTKNERKQLKQYLNGPFRKAIQKKYLNIDYNKQIDAYSEILGVLLAITSVETAVRFSIKFSDSLDKNISKEELKEELYNAWRNEAPNDLMSSPAPWTNDQVFNPVKGFSQGLLNKLGEADLGGSRDVLRKNLIFFERVQNKIFDLIEKQIY